MLKTTHQNLRGAGNDETFHLFVTPQVMADLKLDSDFLANVRQAGVKDQAQACSLARKV